MVPAKILLVGAGNRGNSPFGKFALNHPNLMKFVAVIEPNKERRDYFSNLHNISKPNQFNSVKEFINFKKKTEIDGIINATGDLDHVKTTIPLLNENYPILLEKPISSSYKECNSLLKLWEKNKIPLMVAHELRYAQFYVKIKELISKKTIGEIKSIEMVEEIGDWHFAHSYVRGNWAVEKKSGPISLTKTCHDFDIMGWLLENDHFTQITSYIKEQIFSKKNSPIKNTPKRCSSACPLFSSCSYSIKNTYLKKELIKNEERNFMLRAIDTSLSYNNIKEKVLSGPYGRCVYMCDNDVPDYQETFLKTKNNVSVSLKMTARTPNNNRSIIVVGTRGILSGNLKDNKIIQIGHNNQEYVLPKLKVKKHGGGDEILIKDFVSLVKNNNCLYLTSIKDSLKSHQLAFAAAESAKKQGKLVKLR